MTGTLAPKAQRKLNRPPVRPRPIGSPLGSVRPPFRPTAGFALLAVLWLLVAASVLAGVTLASARLGSTASANRIRLTRAEWAREACVEILLARWAEGRKGGKADGRTDGKADRRTGGQADGRIDLGRGTWCRATLDEPTARLNVNLADGGALRRLLSSALPPYRPSVDSLADALLDWRDPDDLTRPAGAEGEWYRGHHRPLPRNGPLVNIEELRLVRGFDSAVVHQLAPYLTTEGAGTIDLNTASLAVIATLPGIGAEALQVIEDRRRRGKSWGSLDELVAALSPAGQRSLLEAYQQLQQTVVVSPAVLLAEVEGGVRGTAIVARQMITLVPVGTRLAVIRRQAE